MLRNLESLLDYDVSTTDGESCALTNLLFDESSWVISYLVVKTGSWLSGRKVLVRPAVVQAIDDDKQTLRLSVSSEQVRQSPETSTELPISSEAEMILAKYWDWAPSDAKPPLPPEATDGIEHEATAESKISAEEATESRLRSFTEVDGYSIEASDGLLGQLRDLLCNEDWRIQFSVVDTRKWLPGKKVLLPTQSIGQIKWSETSLHVDASRDQVKTAPEYDSEHKLSPEEQASVEDHFSNT